MRFTHLGTVHVLHGVLTEEEVNIILIFNGANKVRIVEMVEVVLFSSQLVTNDEGVRTTEVRDCSAVQTSI